MNWEGIFELVFTMAYSETNWLELIGLSRPTVEFMWSYIEDKANVKWYLRALYFIYHYPTGAIGGWSLRTDKKKLDPDVFERHVREVIDLLWTHLPQV